MIRLLPTLFFVALICLVSNAEAQHPRKRGLFNRHRQVVTGNRRVTSRISDGSIQEEGNQSAYDDSSPPGYESRAAQYNRELLEAHPKYIGGFHSSHFNNIGIPSGDVGFRGNGIFWTPW